MAYSSIVKPSDYFNTKLYTGNGSSQSFTGVGYQPDFTWIKRRGSAEGHSLFDAVRGVQKRLVSNDNGGEAVVSNSLTAFGSDGFTLGGSDTVNGSDNYASWNWKANGAGSANTDGSINSTVSVNTTAGFSIVSWTANGSNATIGHGLGSVPKMIFLKCRTQADKWIVYNSTVGNTKYLVLNSTDAPTTSSTHWNNTSPTSSVFSTGTSGNVSGTGETFIAYCFAEKTGYSKIGSYTGNGNADGTFVYTGFKPAFVMMKRTDNTNHFAIYDNKRNGFNDENNYLRADGTYAEGNETWGDLDILSNGFKPRAVDGMHNASGGTYIYIAFAEEPLIGDNPATAR